MASWRLCGSHGISDLILIQNSKYFWLVFSAADGDIAAELHQVGVDETATMTELNRRRDVSVRLDSYRGGTSSPLTTHLADIVFPI